MKATGVRIIHPAGWIEIRGDVAAQEKRYLASLKRQKITDYERGEFEYEYVETDTHTPDASDRYS